MTYTISRYISKQEQELMKMRASEEDVEWLYGDSCLADHPIRLGGIAQAQVSTLA